MKTCVLFIVLLTVSWCQDDTYLTLECPFPEGQDVASEEECGKYSACGWTNGTCHMKDASSIGYRAISSPEDTDRGFKVQLELTDSNATMFHGDIWRLTFEVIYHEEYHVQIKIYDTDHDRYEVPVPLFLPENSSEARLYEVSVSGVNEPFQFSVTRSSNGNKIFSTVGPLTFEDQFIQINSRLISDYLFGFGENPRNSFRHIFDPRQTYPIFAGDKAVSLGYINEYGHHPYYMVMEDDEGNSHSCLLCNSNAIEYTTFLLDDGSPALGLRTIGGILDFHFFLGSDPEDVNTKYINTIGRPVFPPYWSLGFQLSRWGYGSSDNYRIVRERMKAMGIPQDVQIFDIDSMHRNRDFTYDPTNWGDFPELIEELHNDNVKVVLILDPAVVIDWENYPPSQRGKDADVFVKWMSSDLVPDDQEPGTEEYMVGYVWPDNKTVFPDFLNPATHEWWANEIELFHEEVNFDGLWIDMNEPANFGTNVDKPWNWPEGQEPWSLKCPYNQYDEPPYPTKAVRVGNPESARLSDHSICLSAIHSDGNNTYIDYDSHSLYGWSETMATEMGLERLFPRKRHALLSRSTFPGSGQFAVHWLGDNSADWVHMKVSIVGMFEFNMFGIPMIGADICGFFNEPDMEMCARWTELGAFYPFSRNHNTNGTADQDPAVWPEVAEISRDVLLLRYKYLPYLYSLFHRAHMHGSTVVRPLLNVFPRDIFARDVDDEFMWGNGLLIAAVITQGARERDVYFPEGQWYDIVTGILEATGPSNKTVPAPLEKIPVYVRGGIILPFQEPALTTEESRQNPMGFTVALDNNLSASGEIFWDDGEQEHTMMDTFMANLDYSEGELTMTVQHGAAAAEGLTLETLEFLGFPFVPGQILLNDAALDASAWAYDEEINFLRVSFSVPLNQDLSVKIS